VVVREALVPDPEELVEAVLDDVLEGVMSRAGSDPRRRRG
jgi:hypothetical protein